MTRKMKSPALAAQGLPEVSLAASKIDPENTLTARQAQYISKAFGVPPRRADLLVTLAFASGAPR